MGGRGLKGGKGRSAADSGLRYCRLEDIILKKMGATVKAVCDGAEAVEEVAAAAARGKTYSVVLMDCQVRGWGMGDWGWGRGRGWADACVFADASPGRLLRHTAHS